MDVQNSIQHHDSNALAWRRSAIAVLALQYCLLFGITIGNGPVIDEIGHLTSGVHQWKFGTFHLYRVNPPLVKWIAAVPALLGDPKFEWKHAVDSLHSRPEFAVGLDFIEVNGLDAYWYHAAGRVLVLPLTVLCGWVCFLWARDLYGPRAGFLACLLWCFSPTVLGWGSTFTPDAAASSLGCLAGYRFWKWLRSGDWVDALLCGLALGFAELAKMTWVILFALWPLLWLAWRWMLRGTDDSPRPRLRQLLVILLLGLLLINAGYGFEGSFTPLGQYEFVSESLSGEEGPDAAGNRIRGTWLENVPVPVPWNYLRGMDQQKADFEAGGNSYLLGEWSERGWWYFYIVALLFKEPLGTWGLFLLAIGSVALYRERMSRWRDEVVLLIPALTVMALVSSQTGFTIYIRYVLPCLPFVYIFCSRVVSEVAGLWMKRAALGLVAWTIISVSLVYPYELSYFNELCDGPRGGHRVLLDANIDWGQDLLRLRRWIIAHPEARPIHVRTHGFLGARHLDLPDEPPLAGKSEIPGFSPGWYAISTHHLYASNSAFTALRAREPDAMIGYSMYIYYIAPEP